MIMLVVLVSTDFVEGFKFEIVFIDIYHVFVYMLLKKFMFDRISRYLYRRCIWLTIIVANFSMCKNACLIDII